MTAADPLNTTPWKPLDQDWGEGETVTVVRDRSDVPVAGTDEAGPVRSPAKRVTEPARLIQRDNALDNHAQRVTGLVTSLKAVDDFLSLPKTGARDWASDLRYGDPIIERINHAVTLIHEALDIIDMNENG
jgi:hypothetical protein